MDKCYVDKVEAFEIMLERGIEKLPRKGTEIWTCRVIGHPLGNSVLGKDEQGFYTADNVIA